MTILNKALRELREEVDSLLTEANSLQDIVSNQRIHMIKTLIEQFFDKSLVSLIRKRREICTLCANYLSLFRASRKGFSEPKDIVALLNFSISDDKTLGLAHSLLSFSRHIHDNASKIVDQFSMVTLISAKNRARIISKIEEAFKDLPASLEANIQSFMSSSKEAQDQSLKDRLRALDYLKESMAKSKEEVSNDEVAYFHLSADKGITQLYAYLSVFNGSDQNF